MTHDEPGRVVAEPGYATDEGGTRLRGKLADAQAILGHEFLDESLLEQALTHASIANTRMASNERLEFLGDAVLGMIVCELLYDEFDTSAEGELTRLKSTLVSRATCADIAEEAGLDECLLIGKGLLRHETLPQSIRAAVVESAIAAVYLDGGFPAARRLVKRWVGPKLEQLAEAGAVRNHKSQLQQYCQKRFGETPGYELLDEKGPDHSKAFQVAAVVADRRFEPAWGATKKEAEQLAAGNALGELMAEG